MKKKNHDYSRVTLHEEQTKNGLRRRNSTANTVFHHMMPISSTRPDNQPLDKQAVIAVIFEFFTVCEGC